MSNTRKIGKVHEQRAKAHLEACGYQVIEQNWQCKMGELDFVVIDKNRFNQEYLVFVEVKYRKGGSSMAKFAVDYRKQNQVKKLSQLYLKYKEISEGKTNISYDVIALDCKKLEHVKNIFNF